MTPSFKKLAFLCVVVVVCLAFGLALYGGKPVKPVPVDHKALQQPPIQLGTSGGSATDIANGYCCSGTLGALVKDARNEYYILSNTHVFAGDTVKGGNGLIAAPGDDINHPGYVDTHCGQTTDVTIADLTDSCPVADGVVDAAIAKIRDKNQVSSSILEIGPLNSATRQAEVGLAVKKSGRTTGLTRSTVASVNATITVGYSYECAGASYSSTFTGQILVRNRRFLAGGDSGSLLVEDVADHPRAVGLLYAGSNTIAVANPIDVVLQYFDVSMVGEAVPTGGEIPGGETPSRRDVARALRLQQLNGHVLLQTPGAIGHAVGATNGRAVIQVLVEELTPEALANAPREIDGVPVVVEAIGKVVAY